MAECRTLGDLRRLVESLAGQSDSVPVELQIAVPGLSVPGGSFPTGREWSPVFLRASAISYAVGQSSGYHPGMGPASHILIEGAPT